MDFHQKKDVENKRESAGFLSRLLFLWVMPLFWKGRRKAIDIDDLDNVPAANKAELLSDQLQANWDKVLSNKASKTPNLFSTFLKTFGGRYFLYVIVFCVDGWIVRLAQPMFLKYFIRSFTDEGMTLEWMCIYAAGVCLSTLFHTLLNHPTGFQLCVSGMRCRVALSSLIYRKALRLSRASEGKSSVGQIVNLLSNDVTRFDYNLHFIAYLFVGPVQLILFFFILWEELGIACLAGVGYVLLLSPGQYIIGKLSAVFRVQIAKQTDERSRLLNEIVNAMRLIKQYAWEKPFASIISKLRELEVKALKKRSYLRASYMGVFTSNFTFVPFLSIVTYALLGNSVTPDKAFFAVAVFNVMTEVLMYYVPNAAASVGELKTSIKRVEDFLLMEEQSPNKNLKVAFDVGRPSVHLENVVCRWDGTRANLDSFSLSVEGDKVVMVVGPVGCGKTSLLQCLLSELPIDSGIGVLGGRLSYAAQEAWIFPGTVRQNVLLGKEYVREKYAKVLEVCALEADLKQFSNSDMTIVGDRGVSLSGGQKARINLARALYQDADIYLLDDPLSAVDTAVSRHIFEKCVKAHLKGKLRILVTHQLQYLPMADHVVVLSQGRILAQGSYEDVLKTGIDFVRLMAVEEEGDNKSKKPDEQEEEEDSPDETEEPKDEEERSESKAIKESMGKGSIGPSTYWAYFKSGDSLCGMSFLLSAFLVNQVLISCTDYWLSIWASVEEMEPPRFKRESLLQTTTTTIASTTEELLNDTYSFEEPSLSLDIWADEQFDRSTFLYTYVALALCVILLDTSRTLYFFAYTLRISKNIHSKMFNALVRAPIKFFDENSSGRIMNRFTKDIGTLDEFLPLSMFDTLDIGHRTVGTFIIILVLNYFLIVPAAVLIFTYAFIRRIYIKTSRNIKRVETLTRSPLYTHLSSSMHGIATIRCMGAQRILTHQFDCHQDLHSASWYVFLAGNNWFSIWLELASTLFIAVVVYSFVVFHTHSTIVVGQVGLAVASLLQLMNTFQFGMRQSSEMENFMTSVERVLEYTKLPAEVSQRTNKYPDTKVFKSWPSQGAIRFQNVNLTYDGDLPILKNLSFSISPMEKVGIVGRTGAGKSSIIAALFRMTEISEGGQIIIDGFDTAGIPLSKLRKALSIIPQDPVLFSGSIRYNLDPFGRFQDAELWSVLEEVELKDLIPALDYPVVEGGKNFSVGQRQLVCLARAILRKNKVLVMDEATANVDPRTDNLIQTTIRTKFSTCTIITIAHRLHSVMDCDKILVLDQGNLREYDHPHLLLSNHEAKGGYLQRMVAETGPATQNLLKKMAKEAYESSSSHR